MSFRRNRRSSKTTFGNTRSCACASSNSFNGVLATPSISSNVKPVGIQCVSVCSPEFRGYHYPQTKGYGIRNDLNLPPTVFYLLSLHELRNCMQFIDPKYASPENWKGFADHILNLCPHAGNLLLEYIERNAHPEANIGKDTVLNHVRDYLFRIGIPPPPANFRIAIGKYFGLTRFLKYYLKFDTQITFEEYCEKMSEKSELEDDRDNLLGQLREEIMAKKYTSDVEFTDDIITIFRGKVLLKGSFLRTAKKIYTADEARNILGRVTVNGLPMDIYSVLEFCPYFQTNVSDPSPNTKIFCDIIFTDKWKLTGKKRDLDCTQMWEEYKRWCISIGIASPVQEREFWWTCSFPTNSTGTKFLTSKFPCLKWSSE